MFSYFHNGRGGKGSSFEDAFTNFKNIKQLEEKWLQIMQHSGLLSPQLCHWWRQEASDVKVTRNTNSKGNQFNKFKTESNRWAKMYQGRKDELQKTKQQCIDLHLEL